MSVFPEDSIERRLETILTQHRSGDRIRQECFRRGGAVRQWWDAVTFGWECYRHHRKMTKRTAEDGKKRRVSTRTTVNE